MTCTKRCSLLTVEAATSGERRSNVRRHAKFGTPLICHLGQRLNQRVG